MSYPLYLFPVSGLSGQTLSITTSANVTLSAFPGAQYVELTVTSQNAYVTFDGSVPSSSNGLVLVKDLGSIVWTIDQALAAKFRAAANLASIYATPMVNYITRTDTQSLCSELLTLSSYPINHGF